MNLELKIMLLITRLLPRIRGAGVLANMVKNIYNRRLRSFVRANVLDFSMNLDPSECVDGSLLFYPHLYDWEEVEFIRNNLGTSGVFVDAGANIGFYSLVASQVIACGGQIIAIEPDDYNRARLIENLELNSVKCAKVVSTGLSDKIERIGMYINAAGNRGGNTFIPQKAAVLSEMEIECLTLYETLTRAGLTKVDFLKIDIEGFEYKVLMKFYCEAPPSLWPRFVIVEINKDYALAGSGSIGHLLEENGYHKVLSSELNSIFAMTEVN